MARLQHHHRSPIWRDLVVVVVVVLVVLVVVLVVVVVTVVVVTVVVTTSPQVTIGSEACPEGPVEVTEKRLKTMVS